MPRFHGVAWAIRDKDPVLEATQVAGETKEEIFIEETWRQPIDPRDARSTKDAFDRMLELVVRTVQLQKKEGSGRPVPISLGWPKQFEQAGESSESDLTALGRNLRSRYARLLNAGPQSERSIVTDIISRHVGTRPNLSQADVSPNGRLFQIEGSIAAGIADEKPEREAALQELYEAIENQVPGSGGAAHDLMRYQATMMANGYRHFLPNANRTTFFATAPAMEPFISRHWYNFPGYHNDLRQTYARTLIQLLGLKHNISVKVPQDTQSPAFADPCAAEVADEMDLYRFGEVRPMAVLARHRG